MQKNLPHTRTRRVQLLIKAVRRWRVVQYSIKTTSYCNRHKSWQPPLERRTRKGNTVRPPNRWRRWLFIFMTYMIVCICLLWHTESDITLQFCCQKTKGHHNGRRKWDNRGVPTVCAYLFWLLFFYCCSLLPDYLRAGSQLILKVGYWKTSPG